MTSTRKMLLGTAAATIAVSGGASTGAQAADAALKKAPPIQYVQICSKYGNNFFQIPGTSICLRVGGQLQSDNAYQPTHDTVFVAPSKTTGSYGGGAPGSAANGAVQFANQQDNWGYEVSAKPRFDARTETSVGTLRAYMELNVKVDAGNFNGATGPGGGDTGAGNKTELFRGFLQWAGWTVGYAESLYSQGSMKTGDIADVSQSDKSSGWTAHYVWTPNGPGDPPVKGGAPVPDGWSFGVGVDSPLKHIAKPQFTGGGCAYYDLALTAAGSAAGAGTVCAATGPLSLPDFNARLHYQGDPTGKDDQHNDQFGLAVVHLAANWHQITMINTGGTGLLSPAVFGAACGTGTCAFGPTLHDHGFAVNGFLQFYVPMWPGTTMGSRPGGEADNIQLQVLYCEAQLEGCGIGASLGNLSSGDAYWTGGLGRDDTDGRIINNGFGGYYLDKEKAVSASAQYHWALTNCNDPVHCFVATANANWSWVTPGSITQNVDWSEGGLGKGREEKYTFEISWGTARFNSPKPTFWQVDFEVQYLRMFQTLPCANNGNTGTGVCLLPTAIPLGITKDPTSFVWRTTLTMNW